jgi:integrase
MKTRAEVLAQVRARIRLMHFSVRTEDAYCGWVSRYYEFCRGLRAGMPAEGKVEAFLTELALRRNVSARTQNQAFAAVLFLYRTVLGRQLGDVSALRAKRPRQERTCPSREQIRAFRAEVQDTAATPARLLVDLMYGCGLRVGEPLELRVRDLLWGEGETGRLFLRGAKGGKDRRVPIPRSCVGALKAQVGRARAIWEWDRANAPGIGVPLPFSLSAKYPRAPFHWQWFWVFPSDGHCADPRTGARVRYHLLEDAIQRSVQRAAARAGLEGMITPHVLRHAYATHSREPIEALRQLLGHSSIQTTAGYLHPVIDRASNPLDDMLG